MAGRHRLRPGTGRHHRDAHRTAARQPRAARASRRLLEARDLDGYGRLFADDGEWLGGTGYGQTPAGITAMLNERLPARGPGGPAAWHLVTEPEISLDGDRATGTVTWTWVGRGDAGTPGMRLRRHYP